MEEYYEEKADLIIEKMMRRNKRDIKDKQKLRNRTLKRHSKMSQENAMGSNIHGILSTILSS